MEVQCQFIVIDRNGDSLRHVVPLQELHHVLHRNAHPHNAEAFHGDDARILCNNLFVNRYIAHMGVQI